MITGIINEEWRSISGYVNYQVSNIGRVRNATTEKILKPFLNKGGYYEISLRKESVKKECRIHRLVAQEFIDNPDNKQFVDHINHNKTDNTIFNLRWVSKSENSMNRNKIPNKSSKYKGVCFSKERDKWRARIMLSGRRKHLGYFANEKEAAFAYNEAAIEKFGEYALVNEISSDGEENEEDEESGESDEANYD